MNRIKLFVLRHLIGKRRLSANMTFPDTLHISAKEPGIFISPIFMGDPHIKIIEEDDYLNGLNKHNHTTEVLTSISIQIDHSVNTPHNSETTISNFFERSDLIEAAARAIVRLKFSGCNPDSIKKYEDHCWREYADEIKTVLQSLTPLLNVHDREVRLKALEEAILACKELNNVVIVNSQPEENVHMTVGDIIDNLPEKDNDCVKAINNLILREGV